MSGRFRAFFTVFLLVLITSFLIPIQIVFNFFKRPEQRLLPFVWHKIAARLIGLKIHVEGEISNERPILLAVNHVSWLDIVVLSATYPVCFIAKQEVSGWSIFGYLAKLQRTVFVNREKRSATASKAGEIAERLEKDVMVLFAEGTSTSGTHVLPFKSALLGAAQKTVSRTDATVQSVALAYTHLNGVKITNDERPLIGFYGAMDLAPHLWKVLKEGAIDVTLVFGKSYPITKNTNRKELSKLLEEEVRMMKTKALRR